MAYVYLFQYLHILFFIGIILSVIFTSYQYIGYLLILLFYLLLSWSIEGCFIKDTYENFIEWKYDNNMDRYKDVSKYTKYTFRDKKLDNYKSKYKLLDKNDNKDVAQWIPSISNDTIKDRVWWTTLFIFIMICVIRYLYKLDFISTNIPFTITILLTLTYFLLLIIPAFHHYYITRYTKVFVLYLFCLVSIIYGNYHYHCA